MGCWPIAGMTSLDVNDSDSMATIRAAIESGITHFDTAYCYGRNGESERLLARALPANRNGITVATKCGVAWDANGQRVNDVRPEVLRRQVETSLNRLGVQQVDLLYLHSPDGRTSIEESAGELTSLVSAGKARWVGLSNVCLDEIKRFHSVCPLAAVQLRHNVLQRDIELDIVPWCRTNRISVVAYWPLMKGLLAGKIRRDFQFDPVDPRLKYDVYRGRKWLATQDFIDVLESVAAQMHHTIAQVVVNWSIYRDGITCVLVGASAPTKFVKPVEPRAGA